MSAEHPSSLWEETGTPFESCPVLKESATCDVIVIGAGFTGLRAALRLAEAGTRVVVLDGGDVGWGASGRTGGQVNPMLPFNSPDRVQKLVGPKYFERLTETSLNSADELFDLVQKYQIDCQSRQNGWLRVNHCDKARRVSERNAQSWNKYGADLRPVDASEVQLLTGTTAYRSGVLIKNGGAVQPLSLARGLARAAKAAGVKIFGQSRVSALKQSGSSWTISTAQGLVTADWVILATNGYTDDLFTGLAKSIIPLVPILIATDPLDEDRIGSIMPNGHTVSDTRRVIMFSRREPDDRIVYGGLGKLNIKNEITGFNALKRDAERIFPILKGVDWRFQWGGQIAITDDRLPHFHEPKKGLISGLGYNGRGVAMSHVMGRCLADRVLGAAPDSLPFPTTAISSIPFRGLQMMGKGAAVWYMKALDFLETR